MLCKDRSPEVHTVVGLSNVCFGLKPAARVVLNTAFLHELREAGLTGAIVHASQDPAEDRIPDEQWNAALDLIYDRRREGFDPLTHFIGLFPGDDAADGPRVAREELRRAADRGEAQAAHHRRREGPGGRPRRGDAERVRRWTSSTTSCSTA